MKILIVSGFLGAGKTTFIKELADRSGIRFAVMENEYGAGIDGSILEQDRIKVWEMTDGCICCSLKSDFAMSVLTIANSSGFDFLVVEPTGAGLLSSVISNLLKIVYGRIELAAPVTVVDAHCIDSYLQTFAAFYEDQIKNAARIVLSKTEGMEERETERLRGVLRKLNAGAEIVSAPYVLQPVQWWQSLFNTPFAPPQKVFDFSSAQAVPGKNARRFITEPSHRENTENACLPDLQSFSVKDINITSLETLMYTLQAVMADRFGRVYRLKGFAPVNGQWTRFDITDKRCSIETCKPMSGAKAVIIGKDLNRKELQTLFQNS